MRRVLVLPLLLAALTALAGCSGSDQPEAAPARTTGSPASAPTKYDQYVALGDSYTAAPLVPPTDTSTICLRSGANYPALVAKAMPGTTLTDVSCSGASTVNATHPQTDRSGSTPVPPQFDALERTTDLVTIGLGGNDENLFAGVLGSCVRLAERAPAGDPCTRAAGQRGGLDPILEDIRGRIAAVVDGVRSRSPHARVVVVGYPQIVPGSGTCADLPIATGDYPFARRVNEGLARAVQQGADDAHADYVDLWAPTAGHDICGADPWINGRVTRVGTALAYHPLAVEQEHVAQLVLDVVR